MALGLGSLFNHSTLNQNVGWERNLVAQCITYRALRDVRAGEELYVILESRLSVSNQMLKPESRLAFFLFGDMFHVRKVLDEGSADLETMIQVHQLWTIVVH